MDAEATVKDYYDTLRDGGPLSLYFLRSSRTVKFGVGERLTGYEAVERGLREQTETTEDWTVKSARLLVEERGDHGWFTDDVHMAWTDTDRGVDHAFDTRWSGTLVCEDDDRLETEWRFAEMHVSTAVRPGGEE
jgi:hypothetical protein